MTPYGGLSIGTGGAFGDRGRRRPGHPARGLSGRARCRAALDRPRARRARRAVRRRRCTREPRVSVPPSLRSVRPGPAERPRAPRGRCTSRRSASAGSSSTRCIRSSRTSRCGSRGSPDDAHRIINWIIENRGNYVQWAALDDILTSPDRFAAWQPYTRDAPRLRASAWPPRRPRDRAVRPIEPPARVRSLRRQHGHHPARRRDRRSACR